MKVKVLIKLIKISIKAINNIKEASLNKKKFRQKNLNNKLYLYSEDNFSYKKFYSYKFFVY